MSGGSVSVTLAARSGAILLLAPAVADTGAPSASIALSPAPNANGWNNSAPVTASLSGSDAGSGVQQLRYWVGSGNVVAASGSSASVSVSADGTTVNVRAVDQAGNISGLASRTVRIDTQAPAISASASPAPNASGWNNGAVAIHFTCEDALSGVASCPTDVTLTGEGANQGASGTATDKADNSADASASGIKIDKTAPLTTAAVAPAQVSNTSVTVTLSASDNLAGVAATYYTVDGGAQQTYGGPFTVSGDGEHSLTFWSVDSADNAESASALSVTIDSSAPTIGYSLAPAPNPQGWAKADVTVSFTCAAPSGIASCSAPQTVTSEGQNQAVTGTAVSNSGNTSTATALVSIDKTAPSISAAATSSPNASGWYNSAVTIHFTCEDALSGVATCTPDATLTSEGTSLGASGTASDAAGNTGSASVSGIKIDTTAPSTSATSSVGSTSATVTLSASDNLAGVAATYYTVDGGAQQTYGGPFGVSGAGMHTIVFSSVDRAGNAEAPKSVSVTISSAITNAAVRPVLECVANNGGGTYTARFGYQNDNTVTITILVGGNNKFSPGAADRNQTKSFLPGRQVNQFSVVFNGKNLTWTLKGPDGIARTATASSKSAACAP